MACYSPIKNAEAEPLLDPEAPLQDAAAASEQHGLVEQRHNEDDETTRPLREEAAQPGTTTTPEVRDQVRREAEGWNAGSEAAEQKPNEDDEMTRQLHEESAQLGASATHEARHQRRREAEGSNTAAEAAEQKQDEDKTTLQLQEEAAQPGAGATHEVRDQVQREAKGLNPPSGAGSSSGLAARVSGHSCSLGPGSLSPSESLLVFDMMDCLEVNPESLKKAARFTGNSCCACAGCSAQNDNARSLSFSRIKAIFLEKRLMGCTGGGPRWQKAVQEVISSDWTALANFLHRHDELHDLFSRHVGISTADGHSLESVFTTWTKLIPVIKRTARSVCRQMNIPLEE